MSREALGLIETKGMLGAIEVTRSATEAAQVSIASAEHTESGRVIVKIEGDWETVVKAVTAGARSAEQAQQLVSVHIIPRPDEQVSPILPYQQFIDRYFPSGDFGSSSKSEPRHASGAKSQKAVTQAQPVSAPAMTKPLPKPVPKLPAKPRAVSPREITPVVIDTHESQPHPESQTPFSPDHKPSFAELSALPVVKLRHYARTLNNLPIQGRQISMANKQELLEAIKTITP